MGEYMGKWLRSIESSLFLNFSSEKHSKSTYRKKCLLPRKRSVENRQRELPLYIGKLSAFLETVAGIELNA